MHFLVNAKGPQSRSLHLVRTEEHLHSVGESLTIFTRELKIFTDNWNFYANIIYYILYIHIYIFWRSIKLQLSVKIWAQYTE